MTEARTRSTSAIPSTIRLGTRGSALAMAQSRLVAEQIERATGATVTLTSIRTHGDASRAPLTQIGGTGVFVTAVRAALTAGDVDVAVHSFKDLPTEADPNVCVAAVPVRADPADVLCGAGMATLHGLPDGARIGTGSPRRAAQLVRLRADLRPVPIRGNVDTRLRAVADGSVDGIVVARAGLARLDRLGAVSQAFSPQEMMPAPAQGALAVECRADDAALIGALAAVDDAASRVCAAAERAVLAGLRAGCAAPVGAHATVRGTEISLSARVISPDGATIYERSADGTNPEALGARVAEQLMADGAGEILDGAH